LLLNNHSVFRDNSSLLHSFFFRYKHRFFHLNYKFYTFYSFLFRTFLNRSFARMRHESKKRPHKFKDFQSFILHKRKQIMREEAYDKAKAEAKAKAKAEAKAIAKAEAKARAKARAEAAAKEPHISKSNIKHKSKKIGKHKDKAKSKKIAKRTNKAKDLDLDLNLSMFTDNTHINKKTDTVTDNYIDTHLYTTNEVESHYDSDSDTTSSSTINDSPVSDESSDITWLRSFRKYIISCSNNSFSKTGILSKSKKSFRFINSHRNTSRSRSYIFRNKSRTSRKYGNAALSSFLFYRRKYLFKRFILLKHKFYSVISTDQDPDQDQDSDQDSNQDQDSNPILYQNLSLEQNIDIYKDQNADIDADQNNIFFIFNSICLGINNILFNSTRNNLLDKIKNLHITDIYFFFLFFFSKYNIYFENNKKYYLNLSYRRSLRIK